MLLNPASRMILPILAVIIVVECVVLSPDPKPLKERQMVWGEVDKLGPDGQPIWAEDGNHFVKEKALVHKPYDPKTDGIPLFDVSPRDFVYLIMVLAAYCGGVSCGLAFTVGVGLLAWAEILPKNVPAHPMCLFLGTLPLMLAIAGVFCLTQKR